MLASTFRSAWLTVAASPPGTANTFSALARAVYGTKEERTESGQLSVLNLRSVKTKHDRLTPAVSELIWKSAYLTRVSPAAWVAALLLTAASATTSVVAASTALSFVVTAAALLLALPAMAVVAWPAEAVSV